MSWVHHIPPVVSALAFGYGVGMAAPDAAINDMRAAVDGYRAPMPRAAPRFAYWGNRVRDFRTPRSGGMTSGAAAPAGPPDSLVATSEPSTLARLRRGAGEWSHRRGKIACNAPAGCQNRVPSEMAPEEKLSGLRRPDFDVPISAAALKYVRFLTRTDRGRKQLSSWIKRSGRYEAMIRQALVDRQLPEDLMWVAMIESGFNPRAQSQAGAVGLWQLTRPTGAVYGLKVTSYVDQRKSPLLSSRAAAHHLRDLYQRFRSWKLAFAAYHMGYERLLDQIERHRTTDFDALVRAGALSDETSAYVPRIVAAALVAGNLEHYGFADLKRYDPLSHAELSVPGGASIDLVARAAGVSSATLRKYNPQFLKDRLPPGDDTIVLIPPKKLSRARAALPSLLQRSHHDRGVGAVASVDSFGLGSADGVEEPGWPDDENRLYALPKPHSRSLRGPAGHPARQRTGERGSIQESDRGSQQPAAPPNDARQMVRYRVGAGDTLTGLAAAFHIDLARLAEANDLASDAKLREGALLRLHVRRSVLERWKHNASAGQQITTERDGNAKNHSIAHGQIEQEG